MYEFKENGIYKLNLCTYVKLTFIHQDNNCNGPAHARVSNKQLK